MSFKLRQLWVVAWDLSPCQAFLECFLAFSIEPGCLSLPGNRQQAGQSASCWITVGLNEAAPPVAGTPGLEQRVPGTDSRRRTRSLQTRDSDLAAQPGPGDRDHDGSAAPECCQAVSSLSSSWLGVGLPTWPSDSGGPESLRPAGVTEYNKKRANVRLSRMTQHPNQ